jgi:hypothetical protein
MKYETLETRKDGTKFLSRDMKRAATRLQQVAAAYDSKQQKLVEEVRQLTSIFCAAANVDKAPQAGALMPRALLLRPPHRASIG